MICRKEENTISPFSDSEMTVSVHHSKSGSMMWGWGQLPAANESGNGRVIFVQERKRTFR